MCSSVAAASATSVARASALAIASAAEMAVAFADGCQGFTLAVVVSIRSSLAKLSNQWPFDAL